MQHYVRMLVRTARRACLQQAMMSGSLVSASRLCTSMVDSVVGSGDQAVATVAARSPRSAFARYGGVGMDDMGAGAGESFVHQGVQEGDAAGGSGRSLGHVKCHTGIRNEKYLTFEKTSSKTIVTFTRNK